MTQTRVDTYRTLIEQTFHQASEGEDAPPPYSTTSSTNTHESTHRSRNHKRLPSVTHASDVPRNPEVSYSLQHPIRFPAIFYIYHRGKFHRRQYLIGTQHNIPKNIFFLGTSLNLTSPQIALHCGPTSISTVLATAVASFGVFGITVYDPRTRRRIACVEIFRTSHYFGFKNYSYEFETPAGTGGSREFFEWRHSRGPAVTSLEERGRGWKLIRLRKAPMDGAGFVDKDGCEIVAAWTGAGGPFDCKEARFAFLGSGTTGVLGELFEILAVTSALILFRRMVRDGDAPMTSHSGLQMGGYRPS